MHMLKSMRASFAIFLWCVVEKSFGVAQVSLSGASPCFQGASCDLTCTAVGGTVKTGGFIFSRNGVDVVVCQDKTTCNSYVPAAYGLTIGNDTYSGLSIANFNETTRGGQWCCYDRPTGSPSCKQVITNVVPSGTIDLPSSCTGTAPHTVSCSFANLGTPNASLILSNSSGTLISQTTSPVSYSLTSSGNVTCSVQWPAFPNYVLNIPSVTTECIITSCICLCRCKCTVVIALVVCLAILTAVLLGCSIFLCCIYGCKCPLNCDRTTLTAITIVVIVITVAFIIAVGAYSLNCESECNCAGCYGNPCCQDTYCPDAYKASIAFVVLGCIAVIFAILALVLPKYCCGKERKESVIEATMRDVPLKNQPSSNNPPPSSVALSSGNTRSQDPKPPSDPPKFPWMLKKFVLVNFIKERKTHLVRREWVSQGVSDFNIEMFCAKWPPENQEQLAQQGAAPSQGWELCSVGITSTTDNFSLATELLQDSDKKDNQEQPGRDFSFTTKGEALMQGFIPKKFVLVEVIKGRKTCVVHHSWLVLRKEENGLECFHAALPPNDVEELAQRDAEPSKEWERSPVMILASTDDFQLVKKRMKDIRKAQRRDPNKGGTNGESRSEKLLSPKGPLPPLKNEKERPDPTESRPLPIPHQTTLQTHRRPSTDAHVNMSGSNTSPLPMRNNFTPAQQASGQSESAMPRVSSSSVK